jgi:hypothetical protein
VSKILKSDVTLLITAYRRPENLKRLLDSKFVQTFNRISLSLDGPNGTERDGVLRNRVLGVVSEARNRLDIDLYEYENHVGLFAAVKGALCRELIDRDRKFVLTLEEDCIPSDDLDLYLGHLLNNFSNQIDTQHICFSRHIKANVFMHKSEITYTKYPFVWGWMVSQSTWINANQPVCDIDPERFIAILSQFPHANHNFLKFWNTMLTSCQEIETARALGNLSDLDTNVGLRKWALHSWASPYTLNYWYWNSSKSSLRPPINLIENIGFSDRATHTTKRPRHARQIESFSSKPLKESISRTKEDKFAAIEDRIVFGIK